MITEKDLREAIAECNGKRNPDANTCIKLAAFYTILEHLYPQEVETLPAPSYSYAAMPEIEDKISYTSDSEFGMIVNGRPTDEIMAVMDDLVTSLSVIDPRLYAAVMRKLK